MHGTMNIKLNINLFCKISQSVPRSKHCPSRLQKLIIVVKEKIRRLFWHPHKMYNSLCGENVEFFNVIPDGTWTNR